MKQYIQKLVDRQDLTEDEAAEAMRTIMSGRATQAQMGSFLTALRMRGESVSDVTAFARVMREMGEKIRPRTGRTLVDMCGTGGDRVKTFNISTVASFVVAGAGVPVAKHGNRSVTSKSGSADVLEALGARIDLPPAAVERMIEDIGFGFMFAPVFHASMRHAVGPRKEVGIRTVFNLLGPLTNPAAAGAQVVGVYDAALVQPVARTLLNLGVARALVVHGGGLDEVSTFGPTRVCEVLRGDLLEYEIEPADLGLTRSSAADLAGGDAGENARLALRLLEGGERGPRRDAIVANAAAGIYLGGAAASLREAARAAEASIDHGRALAVLEAFVSRSQEAPA